MSKEFVEIKNLKNKIVDLITICEDLKQTNTNLEQEILELKKENQIKEFENSELRQKYETLKIAKTLTSSSKDSHDAKIKINRIVREIDKCIGLLNK